MVCPKFNFSPQVTLTIYFHCLKVLDTCKFNPISHCLFWGAPVSDNLDEGVFNYHLNCVKNEFWDIIFLFLMCVSYLMLTLESFSRWEGAPRKKLTICLLGKQGAYIICAFVYQNISRVKTKLNNSSHFIHTHTHTGFSLKEGILWNWRMVYRKKEGWKMLLYFLLRMSWLWSESWIQSRSSNPTAKEDDCACFHQRSRAPDLFMTHAQWAPSFCSSCWWSGANDPHKSWTQGLKD